jgi:hypothetical protein
MVSRVVPQRPKIGSSLSAAGPFESSILVRQFDLQAYTPGLVRCVYVFGMARALAVLTDTELPEWHIVST